MVKWIELFEGLSQERIPFDGTGFVLNAQFGRDSNYTRLEIIGFKNIKNFIMSDTSVTFQSDGYKVFVVFEPVTYQKRFMEPFLRDGVEHIPLRWNELNMIELPRHDRLYVSKTPFLSFGSFTIERPEEGNFVFYFFENEEVQANINHFIGQVLKEDLKVPGTSVREIQGFVAENLKKFYEIA
jgi:hypothetical protein